MSRQKVEYPCNPLVDLVAEGFAMFGAGRLNIFKSDFPSCMLWIDCSAKETVAMEYTDLGKVPRVIPDGNGFANIGSQRRIDIP